MRLKTSLALIVMTAALVPPAHAAPKKGKTETAAAPAAPAGRLSWTSDRLPLAVGDLVTVVVDEQAEAREQVSRTATGDRSLKATLRGNIDTGGTSAPSRYDIGLNTGYGTGSKDVGDARRTGGLNAVLTVRVVGFEAEDIVRIEGHKQVLVDGRNQDVQLSGLIRVQDVAAGNTVKSSRIADAVITYKGKKIGPNSSIIGKLLGMVWP